jgi:hypothetical protein
MLDDRHAMTGRLHSFLISAAPQLWVFTALGIWVSFFVVRELKKYFLQHVTKSN